MLARVTRLLFLAWFLALAALVDRGAVHGWSAGVWLGLYLLVLAHPTLLAIEFVLSRRVARRIGGAAVPMGRIVRAWFGEWVASTMVFGWRMPWREAAIPDHLPPSAHGRRGAVFVHGFICNRAVWNPWLERLRALDRPFVAVSLEPVFGEIDGYVAAIEQAVARVEAATGRPPVIVAHSMGGLVARAWLRAAGQPDAPGAPPRVARVVTVGTPHRGTWLAGMALSPNARQMRMGSNWMSGLGGAEPADRSALFTCWWSECDQIVFPPPTAVLAGSEDRQLAGVAHVALCRREEIWRDVLAQLEA